MSTPDNVDPAGDAAPDRAFSLELATPALSVDAGSDSAEPVADPVAAPVAVVDDLEERARALTHAIARELAAVAPAGWQRVAAVFALTVAREAAQIDYSAGNDVVRVEAPESVLRLARAHRALSAQLPSGPWWRLLVDLTNEGKLEADYDYGDEPFPDAQLMPAAAYRADLQEFPRRRLPVWLAAYVAPGGGQARTPQQAAVAARADRAAGVRGVPADGEFPQLPVLWSRWVTLAAAFVAVGSPLGPRVLPSIAWFEGATRSGSTLYLLPGGRAVFSGGLWDAPELDAVYNDGVPPPNLYAGAPDWVADPLLNPRAAAGLLTFCFWWADGRWYRGESPSADGFVTAVPGIWTVRTVANLVSGLVAEDADETMRRAVGALVDAAELGMVTRSLVAAVFAEDRFDVDGALYQFSVAGLAAAEPEQLTEMAAIAAVREFILDQQLDTSGYPLEQLTAERISVGWMVYVPSPTGQLSLGRAIFYVADGGEVERSSSSIPPQVYAEGFEQRHRFRAGSART